MSRDRRDVFKVASASLSTGIALILAIGLACPKHGLGQAPAPPKGRPSDLLKAPPFDRITLIDNTVFDVEPVTPRPLPPVEKKKPEDVRARAGDPFVKKDNGDNEPQVIIHLFEGEPRDFRTKRASIKEVEYFEDMLLAEVDRLIGEREFVRAFERVQLIRNRDPKWRGLDDRINRLLYEEGSASLVEDNARGLRLLTDLRARKPDYPGLADRLASSYAQRIARALEAGDFVTGRRLVRELDEAAPGHPEGRNARTGFIGRAKALAAQANQAGPGDRVDRLAEASRVWPDLEGLEASYREAFRAEPTLTVAVDDLANPVGPFPMSPASNRVSRLLYLPLLATDEEESTRGESPGQLLGSLESFELGKGLRIGLKLGPRWSDGSRPVTAIDVARALADRAVPASPGYNARWADLLDRVEATQDDQLVLKLTRAAMKPEAWLLDPIGPAHAASDGRVTTVDQGRRPVGDGPYRWESSTDSTTLLHSVESGSTARLKRIREVRHPSPAAAVEALLRGEVAMLEHVPADRLGEVVKESERFRVGRFATPSVHRIALDGRNVALRNRKVRRALSLAIDRRTLLEEVVLRRPPDEVNAVADGPFVKGSFVDAPDVKPFEYNPLLARGLIAAARKELGGEAIRLTFEYPSTAEARAVCPKIAEGFALIGVEVKLAERPSRSWSRPSARAGGSTSPTGPDGPRNRSGTPARCSCPVTTPRRRSTPSPRPPARGSCSS